MSTTPKRRSPKATISKAAVERAMLALQQLPAKPKSTQTIQKATSTRGTRSSIRSSARSTAKASLAAALNTTAIAEKKAFLNRKIRDVVSVLLDDSPSKPKKKERKKKKK